MVSPQFCGFASSVWVVPLRNETRVAWWPVCRRTDAEGDPTCAAAWSIIEDSPGAYRLVRDRDDNVWYDTGNGRVFPTLEAAQVACRVDMAITPEGDWLYG